MSPFDPLTLHPALVHFPVALLPAAFAVDLGGMFIRKELCLTRAGYYMIILGFLSAIIAVGTGLFLTGDLEGEAGMAKERHEIFALMTLSAVTITLAFRSYLLIKKKEETNLKLVSLGLTGLTALLALVTGFLGGNIVWSYMIGL